MKMKIYKLLHRIYVTRIKLTNKKLYDKNAE